jgi:hypothetical protein
MSQGRKTLEVDMDFAAISRGIEARNEMKRRAEEAAKKNGSTPRVRTEAEMDNTRHRHADKGILLDLYA